jgi:hypothetical protein
MLSMGILPQGGKAMVSIICRALLGSVLLPALASVALAAPFFMMPPANRGFPNQTIVRPMPIIAPNQFMVLSAATASYANGALTGRSFASVPWVPFTPQGPILPQPFQLRTPSLQFPQLQAALNAAPITYPAMISPYGGGNSAPYYSSYVSIYGNPSQSSMSTGGAGTSTMQSYSGQSPSSSALSNQAAPNYRVNWPLGLRILPPSTESQTLRQQLEALVQLATSQLAGGQVSPQVLQEATQALGQLRNLLREKQYSLPLQVYNDAEQFLNHLEQGFKVLQ